MTVEQSARMAQWWLCVIEGYNAALAGMPFEHTMYGGQERIAWQHGWRSRAWAAQEEVKEQPKPEWVKLIPADSIPVFCFNENILDRDMAIIAEQLKEFFGDRKFLAMRGGDVRIYAIAEKRDGDAT